MLAQGHKAVTPVRLDPTAPRSQVKHSTTEPLRYQPVPEIVEIIPKPSKMHALYLVGIDEL